MWNRSVLKSNAKNVLRRNYWVPLLVCLIFTIVSGNFGGSGNSGTDIVVNLDENSADVLMSALSLFIPFNVSAISETVLVSIFGGLMILIFIIAFLFSVFIVNPLLVGKRRYFINNIENKSEIGVMFKVFTDGNYLNTVKIMLWMNVKTFLWTLCFILPGIVKAYEYHMVAYILAEDGSLSTSEVFDRSKAMTDNHKFDIFVLDLSFIGWMILCGFTFGIGFLFLQPYQDATYAELYYASKGFVPEF